MPFVAIKKIEPLDFFEIMKKILAVLLIGLACLGFASCNNDKDSSEEVKKGDGSTFYVERIAFTSYKWHCILHSTMNCPAIKYGTHKTQYGVEKSRYYFCNKCMDEQLVEKWEKKFKEANKEKK